MQTIQHKRNSLEHLMFHGDFDIKVALSTVDGAEKTVCKLRGIEKEIESLVKNAEHDLYTYYNPAQKHFNRIPLSAALNTQRCADTTDQVQRTASAFERFSTISNAGATIALKMEPESRGLWDVIEGDIVGKLQTEERISSSLPKGNIFVNSMVAVALNCLGKEYPETLEKNQSKSNSRLEWPVSMIQNIKKHGGGAAIESMLPNPVVHPRTTYWVVQALTAYRNDIRGIDAKVDTRIRQAKQFSAQKVYSLWPLNDRNDWDVVSFSFALATLWLQEDDDQSFHPHFSTRELLDTIMKRQMEDGSWKTGCPLYGIDSRSYIYPFPADILYGLYNVMPSRLQQGTVFPEDVLTQRQLNGFIKFLTWAKNNRFQYKESNHTPHESGQYFGWASSAEPGAKYPESWSTAVILRSAKALLATLREATTQIAFQVLSSEESSVDDTPWENRILPKRIKEYFDKHMFQSPRKHWSAILAGPPGTGKTFLARGIAAELAKREKKEPLFVSISPDTILSNPQNTQMHTELKRIFYILKLMHRGLVLFDEIDELVLEREGPAEEVFSRLTTTFMLPMLQQLRDQKKVTFLVGTNHIENFDAAIRREGRFDRIIAIELPDIISRKQFILQRLYDELFSSAGAPLEFLIHKEMKSLQEGTGPISKNREWIRRLDRFQHFDGDFAAFYPIMEELFRHSLATSRTSRNSIRPLIASLRNFLNEKDNSKFAEIANIVQEMALWDDTQYFFHGHLAAVWWMAQGIYYAYQSLTTEQYLDIALMHLNFLIPCLSTNACEQGSQVILFHRVRLLAELLTQMEDRIKRDPRYLAVDQVGDKEMEVIGSEYIKSANHFYHQNEMWHNCLARLTKRLKNGDQQRQRRDYLTVEYNEELLEVQKERILRSDWFSCESEVKSDELTKYLCSSEFRSLITAQQSSMKVRQGIGNNQFRVLWEKQKKEVEKYHYKSSENISTEQVRSEGLLLKEMFEKGVKLLQEQTFDLLQNPVSSKKIKALTEQLVNLHKKIRFFMRGKTTETDSLIKCREETFRYWKDHLYPLSHDVFKHLSHCTKLMHNVFNNIHMFDRIDVKDKGAFVNAGELALDAMEGSFNRWYVRIRELNKLLEARSASSENTKCIFPRPVYIEDVDIVKSTYLADEKIRKRIQNQISFSKSRIENRSVSTEYIGPPLSIKDLMLAATPEENAQYLHPYMADAKIYDGNKFVPASDRIWKNSAFRKMVERILDDLLREKWPTGDENHLTTIPWPLSDGCRSLYIGEFFSFRELNQATDVFITAMQLHKRSGLEKLFNQLSQRDTADVKRELRTAFKEAVKESKFYTDGQDLQWRLGDEPPRNTRLHPKHKLHLMQNKKDIEILKQHQLLWCLQQDVLNDKDLCNHWPVKDEIENETV